MLTVQPSLESCLESTTRQLNHSFFFLGIFIWRHGKEAVKAQLDMRQMRGKGRNNNSANVFCYVSRDWTRVWHVNKPVHRSKRSYNYNQTYSTNKFIPVQNLAFYFRGIRPSSTLAIKDGYEKHSVSQMCTSVGLHIPLTSISMESVSCVILAVLENPDGPGCSIPCLLEGKGQMSSWHSSACLNQKIGTWRTHGGAINAWWQVWWWCGRKWVAA